MRNSTVEDEPSPLYAETCGKPFVAPTLAGTQIADVAVVGGGFTGLSTAFHLAERGVNVIALEAHQAGWGASGRNGGQVNPGLKSDPDQVEEDFGPDLGRRMVEFAWSAPEFTFQLIRRSNIACEAHQAGTMRAAFGARDADAVAKTAEQCVGRGMPVKLLDANDSATATGTNRYLKALVDPRGGQVQPLAYAQGLARAASAAGAQVFGRSPVTSLQRSGGAWSIKTAHGDVRAKAVVLATNGYTDDLWPGLRQSIVPVFSSIVASEPLRPEIANSILPGRAVLYEAGLITVYYRIDDRGRLLMGGRGPQRPGIPRQSLSYLIRYAEQLWPALKGTNWTHHWNGQLAMTTDHYPHIHMPDNGLIACLGYNGRGVALATAMGQQLARLAMGEPARDIPMPVTPIRPIPLHRFWKLGVLAKVWEGRLRSFVQS